MSVLRSLLFAPGNHFRKVEKALTLDADAVILDLEDAVAVAEKVPTRETVAKALSTDRRSKGYSFAALVAVRATNSWRSNLF